MLKICKHCHDPFDTPTTRVFCYKPKCEKARLAYAKEMSKQASLKWRVGNYAVYKDVKVKSNGKRHCQRIVEGKPCGKDTKGNWFYCPNCHSILSDQVPDYEYVY